MPYGLHNYGNTCFLNSILQVLANSDILYHAIQDTYDDGCDDPNCLLCTFERCILAMREDGGGHMVVDQYLQSIIRSFPVFPSKTLQRGRQEDAHEFLVNIILAFSTINNSNHTSKQSSHHSLIGRLFSGSLCSYIYCYGCENISKKIEDMVGLELQINHVHDLDSAIKEYCRIENLNGDNRYACSACNQTSRAQKCLRVESLPKLLSIELKRFRYEANTNTSSKINHYIYYPAYLEMKPYTFLELGEDRQQQPLSATTAAEHAADSQNSEKNGKIKEKTKKKKNVTADKEGTTLYQLVGLVIHVGESVHNGHYISYIQQRDNNNNKNRWYKMDDIQVVEVSEQEAFNQLPYILLYEQVVTTTGSSSSSSTSSAASASSISKRLSYGLPESSAAPIYAHLYTSPSYGYHTNNGSLPLTTPTTSSSSAWLQPTITSQQQHQQQKKSPLYVTNQSAHLLYQSRDLAQYDDPLPPSGPSSSSPSSSLKKRKWPLPSTSSALLPPPPPPPPPPPLLSSLPSLSTSLYHIANNGHQHQLPQQQLVAPQSYSSSRPIAANNGHLLTNTNTDAQQDAIAVLGTAGITGVQVMDTYPSSSSTSTTTTTTTNVLSQALYQLFLWIAFSDDGRENVPGGGEDSIGIAWSEKIHAVWLFLQERCWKGQPQEQQEQQQLKRRRPNNTETLAAAVAASTDEQEQNQPSNEAFEESSSSLWQKLIEFFFLKQQQQSVERPRENLLAVTPVSDTVQQQEQATIRRRRIISKKWG